ncbi:competence/damage-inducible protein A [Sphingobacterium bovistauri]|uniref:CinA-like protein n=1 Tax=Sphingobacterium bovistauri TaxID=2781959 RepID=A0ABS7Z5E9_9SPHI|nr:competence/damage-inducible protein A [Sphingobacterium bovistauri]MCA5005423.1 competence/damage-inducible protein A [Sphingobacterium bovistauri]
MNAEIITIGDEILIGQIVDSNSAWIGNQLNLLNIPVVQITSISDLAEKITETLVQAASRAELVIVTGGLGPTKDDVTKETISAFFGKPLVRNQSVLTHVEGIFARVASGREMPEVNMRQADVIEGCEVLFNDVGTAPGMWIEREGKIFVFMPGVPFEMKYLMTNRILPKLGQLDTHLLIKHRHLITIGLGESFLAAKIEDIENSLPPTIKLAYLPKLGLVRLRLTQYGNSDDKIDVFHEKLIERLDNHVVSTKDVTIEEAIVEHFAEDNIKLATAESCTGGRISSAITAVSGASAMFDCGIVAYQNTIKQQILGVKEETLKKFGAVSEQTVIEMAEGVKKLANADYSIATSGIAGPGGGTPEKPIGTVWVAISGRVETQTRLFQFHNDRLINIERTVANAFAMLWNMYIKERGN